jgi:hypothetical protein
MNEIAMLRTGGCACGQVEYELNGNIWGARSCHCSRCRKAFSAQAGSYALITPGSLRWIKGEALLTTYPEEGNTGKKFCKRCGTTLCGVMDGAIHGITLGSLNDDAGIEIKAHIFVASKASWEVIPKEVPQYDEYPPDMDILTKP